MEVFLCITLCTVFEIQAVLEYHGEKLWCVCWSVLFGLQYIAKSSRCISISKKCGSASPKVSIMNHRLFQNCLRHCEQDLDFSSFIAINLSSNQHMNCKTTVNFLTTLWSSSAAVIFSSKGPRELPKQLTPTPTTCWLLIQLIIWDKLFKNGPSKVCGRQPYSVCGRQP